MNFEYSFLVVSTIFFFAAHAFIAARQRTERITPKTIKTDRIINFVSMFVLTVACVIFTVSVVFNEFIFK